MTYTQLVLPLSVVSKADVARLVREAEKVDNDLTSAAIHAKVGTAETQRPVISEQFMEFLQLNKLMLTSSRDRTELIKQMRLLKEKAPVIHMTFATVADPDSLRQLAQWLRASIHPQAVIAVGIQPGLVAGVYLRTTNHVYDLSLRAALKGSRQVLTKELGALRGTR